MHLEPRSKWVKSLSIESRERVRLFVFPYAGGGAVSFRAWRERLPSWISLELIQLPGREIRFNEKAASQVADITVPVADAVMLQSDVPIVLFGHSMGSILAFEVARELRRRGGQPPSALVVSGRCAPHLKSRTPLLAHLGSHDLVGRVTQLYGGIPPAALQDSELVELMARVLKSDLRVVESYAYQPEPPLDYPVIAFGGASDPLVSGTELDAWREQTAGAFTSALFPGDHFYLRSTDGENSLLEKLRLICASARALHA